MMRKTATIILNRNLPIPTDALCENIMKYNDSVTDIYVVEAGSDDDNLSRNTTWHANWPDARKYGLRYQRGMNYGLIKLLEEELFYDYDAFFLLTNDTEFELKPVIQPLMEIMDRHPCLGILSPCSKRWGEKKLLEKENTRYFWYIHNNAYFLRREFIESLIDLEEFDYMNFLFDGANFRGYGAESELIAKGYVNDWASGITSSVWVHENESYLLNKSELIKTETFKDNLKLYVQEGRRWMKKKYGFNSRWSLQMYVKFLYDKFFEFHPEFIKYKV